MEAAQAQILVADDLRIFLRPRYRTVPTWVRCDAVSTLGHLVQSIGVPLTEVGSLTVTGKPGRPGRPGKQAPPSYRPQAGDVVRVDAVRRPEPLSAAGFLLDVHLGTLARRLRLLGLDAAYSNQADDDELIEHANAQHRLLLTQDRGLLCRRALRAGAYVRGARPDDQLADVLDRFSPELSPWTRCPACNGPLTAVSKARVDPLLRPGTRRTYEDFSQCHDCGKAYWRGAHATTLEAIVRASVCRSRHHSEHYSIWKEY
ncbi:MAG TPA: Mut7-C RNAse domain-containing protein [Streptosporangiaceae bacterium]|nr:Mut7-C RNAse domain-containing protein [Streptosporangiaceae bacterium]